MNGVRVPFDMRVFYFECFNNSSKGVNQFVRDLKQKLISINAKQFTVCMVFSVDTPDAYIDGAFDDLEQTSNDLTICFMACRESKTRDNWKSVLQSGAEEKVYKAYGKQFDPITFEHVWTYREEDLDPYIPVNLITHDAYTNANRKGYQHMIEQCDTQNLGGRKSTARRILNKIITNDISDLTLVLGFTYKVTNKEFAPMLKILKGAADARNIIISPVYIDLDKPEFAHMTKERIKRLQKRLDSGAIEITIKQ